MLCTRAALRLVAAHSVARERSSNNVPELSQDHERGQDESRPRVSLGSKQGRVIGLTLHVELNFEVSKENSDRLRLAGKEQVSVAACEKDKKASIAVHVRVHNNIISVKLTA